MVVGPGVAGLEEGRGGCGCGGGWGRWLLLLLLLRACQGRTAPANQGRVRPQERLIKRRRRLDPHPPTLLGGGKRLCLRRLLRHDALAPLPVPLPPPHHHARGAELLSLVGGCGGGGVIASAAGLEEGGLLCCMLILWWWGVRAAAP